MNLYQNILVIDDDPIARTILSSYFASTGEANIQEAANGAEALNLICSSAVEFDLIISDLNMPQMDGLEFLDRLKNLNFTGELILISGEHVAVLQSAEELAIAYDIGLRASIAKPLSKQKLDNTFQTSHPRAPRSALSTSLEQDRLRHNIKEHRITAHYQPRVDVKNGKIVCAEALARCQDFHSGLVEADQFIPVAKENRLLGDLTGVMLTQVLQQLNIWNSHGIMVDLAVHLGVSQFVSDGLPHYLSKIVHEFALDPTRLKLEISEQEITQEFTKVIAAAARLRMQGYEICIADFGTGNLGLERLQRIPFTAVKINKTVLQAATSDGAAKEIVAAGTRLAEASDIQIIAAGVETKEHWEFVVASGINTAQGYLFARPMPAIQFEHWYLEKSAIIQAHSELDQSIEEQSTTMPQRQEAV